MINTILVEDDLYIQKHFVDRLAADGEFHLVGVFRDAFEAEKALRRHRKARPYGCADAA